MLALVTQPHAVLLATLAIAKLLMETVSVEQTVISTVTVAAMSTALHVNEAKMLSCILYYYCYN